MQWIIMEQEESSCLIEIVPWFLITLFRPYSYQTLLLSDPQLKLLHCTDLSPSPSMLFLVIDDLEFLPGMLSSSSCSTSES